jgi:hypothetical protein
VGKPLNGDAAARKLVTAAWCYAGLGIVAAVVAVVEDWPARCLGIHLHGPIALQAFFGGTAISAPAYMLAMFAWFAWRFETKPRPARRALVILAALAIAGILGEEITYRALSPGGFDAMAAGFVVANLLVPAAVIVCGRAVNRG